jgi:hypothetical protein
MNAEEVETIRERWQPAPGSRLAVALEAAEEAAGQWRTIRARVFGLQEERAGVQAALDAVGPDSDMGAAATAIGLAQALDLAVMRGMLELSRRKVAMDTADSDVAGIIEGLHMSDRPVNDVKRRWGENSDEYRKALRERAAFHMRYLATPEGAPG